MEKNTVTIEIKQEVSMTLLWIVAGVVIVSLVFLLTPGSTDLWAPTNAADVAAAVFLIALLSYVLRTPISARLRMWIGIAAALIMAFGAFNSMLMENQTRWQAERLMFIRGVIGRGVMRYDMIPEMLGTLNKYHHQTSVRKESLGEIFSGRHAGVSVGSNIHKPEWPSDSLKIIVAKLEPDLIALVSQETFVKGRNALFRNYNGQFGMVQEKFILTEKGITHVSEN